MISLLFIAFSYCCSQRDLHFSISDWFDMMSCPMCFLGLYPPPFPPVHTHKHTHTHSSFPLWRGFSDSSLISHVLVLNFSKGDRQLLLLASKAITTPATGTSRTLPLSPHSKASKRWEMHFKMQNTKQPHWRCHKIFHYPDTRTDQISNVLLPRSLCLCNMMRWLSTTSSSEHFYRNQKKLKKLEKSVYPLMSLLVCLCLSTRICGMLQTAHMCLKWGQHG